MNTHALRTVLKGIEVKRSFQEECCRYKTVHKVKLPWTPNIFIMIRKYHQSGVLILFPVMHFSYLLSSMYNMEVLRDPEAKFQPLFRVTSDDGEQFKGSSPSACWNKIYKRSRKLQGDLPNDVNSEGFFLQFKGSLVPAVK
ncbi:uncharacterized protein LOC113318625 isoform X2 [Papaver somniferum]|uniref:uncharacterized protein LOC113318625 isoform X2 n=1 Tax=Papaver somniferum TaxID=3469 RepID=UPI000E7047F7|nr:uncharacterized protein LOC113318625 isoform X2 [Papaver somniferum]